MERSVHELATGAGSHIAVARARLEEQGGPKVELELDALTGARLPTTVETVVFRITQEALTNVVKHAEAKTVRDWRRGCGSKRSGEPAPKVVAP